MTDNQHIDLGPDDVIREGDECLDTSCLPYMYFPVNPKTVGLRIGEGVSGYRRPRAPMIRDAAMDVCEAWEKLGDVPIDIVLALCGSIVKLREALGVTVEELRK